MLSSPGRRQHRSQMIAFRSGYADQIYILSRAQFLKIRVALPDPVLCRHFKKPTLSAVTDRHNIDIEKASVRRHVDFAEGADTDHSCFERCHHSQPLVPIKRICRRFELSKPMA